MYRDRDAPPAATAISPRYLNPFKKDDQVRPSNSPNVAFGYGPPVGYASGGHAYQNYSRGRQSHNYSPRHHMSHANFSRGRGHPYLQGPRPNYGWNNFRGPCGHGQNQNHTDHEKSSPWMTPQLLKLIQEKEEAWKVCNENRSEENQRNFKIKRIEVNMAVNDAKLLFYQKNPQSGQCSDSYTQIFRRGVKKTEFYCEPCDKEFISQELLDDHKTEHITCKLDGCPYTAHVKLVMKHIEIQHSSNLFQRIKGYDTPEGIEKWKQDRRKNFPTPDNMARKKAEIAERRARGDTLTAKEDFPGIEVFRHKIVPEERKPRSRRDGPGYQSDGDEDLFPAFRLRPENIRFMKHNQSPAIRLHNFYTDIVVSEDGALVGSTREIWTSQGDDGCNEFSSSHQKSEDVKDQEFNITDDEDEAVHQIHRVVIRQSKNESELLCSSEPHKSTTTTSLISKNVEDATINVTKSASLAGLADYGSDLGSDIEEEDGEIKSDVEIEENMDDRPMHKAVVSTCIDPPLSSDDEGPDEVPAIVSKLDHPACSENTGSCTNALTYKSDRVQTKDNDSDLTKRIQNPGIGKAKKSRKQCLKPQTHVQRAQSVRRKYSLLQRLLAPDIRREKNMVLQVCRFLVDRNFLDPVPATAVAEFDNKRLQTKTQIPIVKPISDFSSEIPTLISLNSENR